MWFPDILEKQLPAHVYMYLFAPVSEELFDGRFNFLHVKVWSRSDMDEVRILK